MFTMIKIKRTKENDYKKWKKREITKKGKVKKK